MANCWRSLTTTTNGSLPELSFESASRKVRMLASGGIQLANGCAYQRLIQPPPPPTRRLIQPPPPPPLIQPPARLTQPPPLIQPPPRIAPLRFIHPATVFDEEPIKIPPAIAAKAAAPDHFPRLRRNKRRFKNSSFSACTPPSFDASSFIRVRSACLLLLGPHVSGQRGEMHGGNAPLVRFLCHG
jgi:hypothetical protein